MKADTAGRSQTEGRHPRNVAIVGFGTVGHSVAKILCARWQPGLRLTHICNRNIERKRVDWVPSNVQWTDRIEDVLSGDVDIVVELIGGLSPAEEWIRRALESGKSVVTANKQVVAYHGPALFDLARRRGLRIGFEASVGGGIPAIRGIQEGLAGDRLVSIQGVLNGTCNFILTRMEATHVSMSEAVTEAQRLGYAEADASDDLDGVDAQAKLAILSAVGLQRRIDPADITRRSIVGVEPVDFEYGRRMTRTIRQVSHAELDPTDDTRVQAWVLPALVPVASRLAHVAGSQNVVVAEGQFGGETAFVGYGAGGDPTAVAVVSDLVSIAGGGGGVAASQFPEPGVAHEVVPDFVSPHYVRLSLAGYAGVGQSVADRFARQGARINTIWEDPTAAKGQSRVVIVLERCSRLLVAEVLRIVDTETITARPGVWLPIVG